MAEGGGGIERVQRAMEWERKRERARAKDATHTHVNMSQVLPCCGDKFFLHFHWGIGERCQAQKDIIERFDKEENS